MCYEKRQMIWKGMSGSCWTDLVQQWRVGKVEVLGIAATKVNCSYDEGSGTKAWGPALEGINMDGPREQSAANRGSWHAGGSQAC